MSDIERLLQSAIDDNSEWIEEAKFHAFVESTEFPQAVNRWIEQIGEGA